MLGYAALVHTLDGLDEWTRTQYVDRDGIVTDLTLVVFAQEGTIDEDLIVWSIDRLGKITNDDTANNNNKPRRSTPSSSNKTKSSGRSSLASSQNSKRRESIDSTSPRTVVNQPHTKPVEVTP